jgi:hypothetical protein
VQGRDGEVTVAEAEIGEVEVEVETGGEAVAGEDVAPEEDVVPTGSMSMVMITQRPVDRLILRFVSSPSRRFICSFVNVWSVNLIGILKWPIVFNVSCFRMESR